MTTPSASAGPVASATTPPDVVAGIYSAFSTGDLAGVLGLLHPDVDWSIDVTAPGGDLVPMLSHGIGHGAAEGYFAGVAQLEIQVFDVGRLLVDGDVVVAEVHMEATHRRTGKRAVLDELHHWTVRDGLAVRYRPYLDTAALIELYRL